MRTIGAHADAVESIAVTPDGGAVFSGAGAEIARWSIGRGEREQAWRLEGDASVWRIAAGRDALYAGDSNGCVWRVSGGDVRQLAHAVEYDGVGGLDVSPDGDLAVCGGEPFEVVLLEPDGTERWRRATYKWPYSVRFSPDGARLLITTWDGDLHVVDPNAPGDLSHAESYRGGGMGVFAAAFLPDGRIVAGNDNAALVWDVAEGPPRALIIGAEVLAVAVVRGGIYAVAAVNDETVRLLRIADLEEIGRVALGGTAVAGQKTRRRDVPVYAGYSTAAGPGTVRALAVHPDGERVYAGTDDGRVIELTCDDLGAR